MNYPAEQYVAVLDQLVASSPNPKRDDFYVDILQEFLAKYPDAFFAFLEDIRNADPDRKTTPFKEQLRQVEGLLESLYGDANFPRIDAVVPGDSVSVEDANHWMYDTVLPTLNMSALMRRYGKLVYSRIWSVLRGQKDLSDGDLVQEARELAHQVWIWAFEHLTELLKADDETLNKRVCAESWTIARNWKTRSLRRKRRFLEINIEGISKAEDGTLFMEPTTDGGRATTVGSLFHEKRIDKPSETVPSLGKMLCQSCKTLTPVMAQTEGIISLSCGHTRPSAL